MKNLNSLDSLCAALTHLMGADTPGCAAEKSKELVDFCENKLDGEKLDRVFMYNPDAIAQWVYEKYEYLVKEVKACTDIEVPFCTVMPSVTPVCFGTMYTGAQPETHGIQAYRKPVIAIDTIFDALIRSGKKPAIVSTSNDSLSMIFLERDMDYFIYDTVEEVNAKAAQLIVEDKYDFIVVYNGTYDSVMHKFGPESVEALGELRANVRTFGMFEAMIRENWKNHNSLVGFAMDHGCHEIDGDCGSHGLDMDEDLNIVHLYKLHKKIK